MAALLLRQYLTRVAATFARLTAMFPHKSVRTRRFARYIGAVLYTVAFACVAPFIISLETVFTL